MKTIYFATSFMIPLLGFASAAQAECGSFTIASMNWQSAEVLANLDKFILNEGFGCNAEIIIGDTVPSITSQVEKGQPEVIPEGWVGLLPEVVNKGLGEGKIVTLAHALKDGGSQGWYLPKYMQDAHPELQTVQDVLAHPEWFPAPEDPSRGALFNGPQGWGGTVITAQLFKAFGFGEHGFDLIDTGSAAGLDGSIARAYERKEPWFGYYWAPTALLGKYPMVKLGSGLPHDATEWARCTSVVDCADPKPNDWPIDEVVTLAAKDFAEKTDPAVLAYLGKRTWSNNTVNTLIAWMTDTQATGEDGAKEFLRTHPEIWMDWVSPDVAEKVKSAL